MKLSKEEAKRITDRVLSFVKADDASVSVSSNKNSNLRFARNAFLTSGSTTEFSAAITVWKDQKAGSASTSSFDDDSLRSMVAQAEKVASLSPVDRQYIKTVGVQKYRPVDGFAESTSNIELEDRARRAAKVIRESERRGVITAGFHNADAVAEANATKNGNFGFEKRTYVSLSVTARTRDGRSAGYFQRGHQDVSKLDTDRIANEAINKAADGIGAKAIEPGVYPVILEPQAVGDLYGRFRFQFDARRAEEGRSPFSAARGKSRLGEQVFDSDLDILSDPWHPDVPGSQSAQGGIPADRMYLVKEGRLNNLVYSRFWANRKNTNPTPGPVNLIMRSANGKGVSVEDMIKNSSRALLIGRFWYIRTTDARTASVTGLTRDGVWLVKNGKIAHPVMNLRFNQSLMNAIGYGNIEAVGKSERIGTSSLMPALKLKEFKFTSLSEAV